MFQKLHVAGGILKALFSCFRSQEQLQSTGIVWEDADNFNLLPKGMSYSSHTILWKQPFSISPCSEKNSSKI